MSLPPRSDATERDTTRRPYSAGWKKVHDPKEIAVTSRLRFGVFLAPFHKPGVNPTLALQNDLDLISWLDQCGYDEAWFGEHHSAGSEISASPSPRGSEASCTISE